MRIKGIKRGKTIETFEEINIPDGQEIIIYMTNIENTEIFNSKAEFWDNLEKFRQEENLETVGIEPEIFADVRDNSPGREVNL